MKTSKRLYYCAFTLLGASLLLISSCEKDNEGNTLQTNPPLLITAEVTEVTQTTAVSGGNITADGGATVTSRGICWSTSQNPTISDDKTADGNGAGSFTSNLVGLEPNTTYYVRAYATNSSGIGYGSTMSFTTLEQVVDADGNSYTTVNIGTQTWMVENLRTTKYRDGSSIPNITDRIAWEALNTPAYIWFNNDIANKSIYGALYNWHTVNTGKLCPTGWHVPTDDEWTQLTNLLGGESIAGDKLKETGTTHWLAPNEGATNETGFTALPGGYRYSTGHFYLIGNVGYWWSATWNYANGALVRFMDSSSGRVHKGGNDPRQGCSVRCLKN